ANWPAVRKKRLEYATEIFLRLLKGETLNSSMIATRSINGTPLEPRWRFPNLKIVPHDVRMDLLRLMIGSHDPQLQAFANTLLPVGVFNLSITPGEEIEKTNVRMQTQYSGKWHRRLMPRTVLVFIADDPAQ